AARIAGIRPIRGCLGGGVPRDRDLQLPAVRQSAGVRFPLSTGRAGTEPAGGGVRNVKPGVYYMLLARPEFSGVFPWMRMVFRFPFDSAERHPLPPEYFVEPTVG